MKSMNNSVFKRRSKHTKTTNGTDTTLQIIAKHTFTYFNFIFAILSILLILAHDYSDLIAFLPILIANTAIGIYQNIRAQKALEELNFLHTPTVTLLNDGKKQEVPVQQLTQGDTIALTMGMQIPCDMMLTDGTLLVNEALVTGESTEIEKQPDDLILSGSIVIAGNGTGTVSLSCEQSYISSLEQQARSEESHETSDIFTSLNYFLKIIGILIIPIGILLFIQNYYYNGDTFSYSIATAVAAIIGMIPEGLYLLASMALAYSALRLAQIDVLVHDLQCIETLSRIDVLCVDKTGTITSTQMEVAGIYPPEHNEQILPLLEQYIAACEDTNETMAALRKYFPDAACTLPVMEMQPFSSVRKYSSITFTLSDKKCRFFLGAPESLIPHLENFPALAQALAGAVKKGLRTLLFAFEEEQQICPLLLLTLCNPLRPSAVTTFDFFTQNGVAIKVISGDAPATVCSVAAAAGIPDSEKFIDASQLPFEHTWDKEQLGQTVYGRMIPEQKKSLVRALQEQGHRVAMTGDGVNDVLALRSADLGIALASGTKAAASIAQLVLLDSDFSKMPAIVREGRRVITNLERTAALFFLKNIFSFCLSLYSIICCDTYPLLPSQITLLSMFTIGLPGLFLSMEKSTGQPMGITKAAPAANAANQPRLKLRHPFLARVLFFSLPPALTDFAAVSLFSRIGSILMIPTAEISTACTFLLCFIGLYSLLYFCRPLNKHHVILVLAMCGGILFCTFLMGGFFHITLLSGRCFGLFALFCEGAFFFKNALQYLFLRFSRFLAQRKLS